MLDSEALLILSGTGNESQVIARMKGPGKSE